MKVFYKIYLVCMVSLVFADELQLTQQGVFAGELQLTQKDYDVIEDEILNDTEDYPDVDVNEIINQVFDTIQRDTTVPLSKRWTLPVPYFFSYYLDHNYMRNDIKKAFVEIKSKTCISFRPIRKGDLQYLYFRRDKKCMSYDGKVGGRQTVSFNTNCYNTNAVMTWIVRALGFHSNQQKLDNGTYQGLSAHDASRLNAMYKCNIPGCTFTTGDGTGGSEMNIGIKPNAAECFKACVEKKKTISNINGVTISSGSPVNIKCYCEKGMTGNNGNKVWKTCKLPTTGCIVDGKTYKVGEKYNPRGDLCTSCDCSISGPRCKSTKCVKPKCANPILKKGTCCDYKCPVLSVPTPGCTFTTGDGTGGSEMNIGIKPNAAECFKACVEKKKTISNINGVTISSGSPVNIKCYCEKGMTGNNGNKVWKTCKLPTDPNLQRYNKLKGKTIALKSFHNRYVVAESNGLANANRGGIGPWEKFKVELLGNFKIALKSFHNKYLVSEYNGLANANRVSRGPWEIFTIEFVDDKRVAFKSHFNKYLVAEKSGQLNANRAGRGPWEIFTLVIV